MTGATLGLIVLLGQVPSSDPSALIARLGSGRYAEREAAVVALEGIGRPALPGLRFARASKDPEVRSRATALIDRIEGSLLTKATLLTLDYRDRPLVEVVKAMGEQAGITLAIFPEQAPGVQTRRVTLVEAAPVPFWKAIDRLCDAGQLQYNFGGLQGLPNTREAVFPLFAGGTRPAGPMSDVGPFRVNLVSLHYQRDISFVPNLQPALANRLGALKLPALRDAGQPQTNLSEQFYAQVQLAAEPRLSISVNGPLKVLEAVDDRGQSLLIPRGTNAVSHRFSGYFGLTAGSTLHLQAPLKRPDQPGKVIRRLKGEVPILVATRKPGPLIIPLPGAAGKSFRNEEVAVGVEDIRVNPNTNQTSIEISVKAMTAQGQAAAAATPDVEFALQRHPETHQQQIEVLDTQGRPIPWYHSNDGEGSRMTLTLTPHDHGPPAEIRYYSMAKATTEVRFEFAEIPLP